ncbi:MAG: ABC transporter permease, partial [Gammaproteobacteria bacterium]|nr:ABC transporter permease [Gammaproteobacteria bacterium]
MFTYNLRLAWLSLKQTPILTVLTISLIALGVGLSMTTLTLHYMMSSDPIPAKSDVLFNVQIDSWEEDEPYDDDDVTAAPDQLTYLDAMALRDLPGAKRQAAMFKGIFTVVPPNEEVKPFLEETRMTDGDFFAMFEVPFLYGGPWQKSVDQQTERVLVLSRETNDKVFGGKDSVGERLQIGSEYFEVVGVTDTWEPVINFYDVNNGPFDEIPQIFMPFSLLQFGEMDRSGNTNCWGTDTINGWEDFLASKCVWIQFWVEVEMPEQINTFQRNLDDYVTGQKELGRHPRPLNNPLMDVNAWLKHKEVVSEDNMVLMGLSFLFLIVCLFNAIGILLARFVGKAPVISVRRALGA